MHSLWLMIFVKFNFEYAPLFQVSKVPQRMKRQFVKNADILDILFNEYLFTP